METSAILHRTLNRMDSKFTSNQFVKMARKNGLKEVDIQNGVQNGFLKSCCIQNGRRMWTKKGLPDISLPSKLFEQEDVPKSMRMNEADCIAFLKSNGYRITKLVEY